MRHSPPSSDADGAAAPSPGVWGRLRGRLGAPGSQRRVLTRNALWNWSTFALNALVVYFLSPYIVGKLGTEAYGIWAIVMTMTGYFGFADFGIRPAIVHFIAKHDALKAPDEVNRFVNTAFVTFAAGGVVVLLGSVAASQVLPAAFGVPAALRSDAAWAVIVTGLTLAVTMPPNAFSAVLIGRQRFDITCRTDLFCTLIRTAAVVFVLHQGYGLVGLALANLLTEIVEMTWKSIDAFRLTPWLQFAPRLANGKRARALLAFGGLNIVVAVAMQLTYDTDAWVIGACLTLPMVTFFALPAKLAVYTRSMLWQVGRVLTPAIGALEAEKGRSAPEIRSLLRGSARTMLLISAPVLVYLMFMGGAFLERWLGSSAFREHGELPLLIMALGAAAPIASFPLVATHYGTNRMRSLAGFSALEGGLNLALSLALVRPFGIAGVAMGTAIPGFLVHFVLMPVFICREFAMSWLRYTLHVWALPILAGALTALALWFGVDTRASHGWPMLIGSALGCAALYFGIALVLQRVVRRSTDAPPVQPEAVNP